MAISSPGCIAMGGVLATCLVLRRDLLRRRLTLTRTAGWRLLSVLDIASTAATAGVFACCSLALLPIAASEAVVPLRSPLTWGAVSCALIFVFLWREGRCQIQFQRPRGIVVAEGLVLTGCSQILATGLLREFLSLPRTLSLNILAAGAMVGGGSLIGLIVPPFTKRGAEYHHILDHLVEHGESRQKEYSAPTPECPNPELWSMVDSQSTELEVLDFLKTLVRTVKPHLIVETGTFLGYGTIALAEGVKTNGFGRIITVECDPVIYAKAKERIEAAGLARWVECRNESSLMTRINGTIDLLFSDSALAVREQEIRRLLPQVDSRGLIAIHDASSHFQVVRDFAQRMEQEGLISVVLMSTPRGLVIAQRREGRK